MADAKARAEPRSAEEAARLRQRWPTEFRDGARGAFLMRFDGQREPGGYPLGFHGWPLERRNAWFAGFNVTLRGGPRLSWGARAAVGHPVPR